MSTKVKGDKIKEGSIPLSALSNEVKDKIEKTQEKVLIMPEDFMEEEYNEPDEDGANGKVKQVYVTDILENRYNKINIDGVLGDINIIDDFIIITTKYEAFQTEEKQESYLEIIIRVQNCKFTQQFYLNRSPFVTSSTDAANINGDIRYSFVKSVTDSEITIPEENKQLFKKNMGSFADWNAQKGEAGYIENRTHYNSENTILQKIDDKNLDEINIKGYDRIHIIYDYKNGETDYIIIDVKNKYIIDSTLENWKHGYTDYYFNDDSFGLWVDDYDYDVLPNINVIGYITKQLDEVCIPDTIARKSDIPVPIIINYNTIKDAANSEVNTISEQTWLKYIANDTYKNYDWIIQRDGIKYNCTVIPDYDNEHIQILYFTRNEIEGTSGPLGNAIMKYSGLRIQLLPYTENTYLIYKISNGGSLETREFVFGENYNNNAYLIAAAQMSGIDTIDCKWVYTTKDDSTITVNGQYFYIENSITNVDAIFSVKDKSLTYVDGNGLINKVTFADNGRYDISKNNPDIPDTVVKTTPQTLSNDDKNQALANLGIDLNLLMYSMNPIVITFSQRIPEELWDTDANRLKGEEWVSDQNYRIYAPIKVFELTSGTISDLYYNNEGYYVQDGSSLIPVYIVNGILSYDKEVVVGH